MSNTKHHKRQTRKVRDQSKKEQKLISLWTSLDIEEQKKKFAKAHQKAMWHIMFGRPLLAEMVVAVIGFTMVHMMGVAIQHT